ncbi:MAG: hypothetical protein JWL89_338 [Candidatus Saccharibacteria bacterium]|nr:hypothetical protein [Candidatus Saccharibacteria bacterium]
MQLREDVPANTSPEKAKYTDPSAFDKNFDLREVGVRVYPHPQDYIPGLAEYDEAPRILQAARERRAPEIVAHTAAHTAVEQTILLY